MGWGSAPTGLSDLPVQQLDLLIEAGVPAENIIAESECAVVDAAKACGTHSGSLFVVPTEKVLGGEWGRVFGERPHLERDGCPPDADDPYARGLPTPATAPRPKRAPKSPKRPRYNDVGERVDSGDDLEDESDFEGYDDDMFERAMGGGGGGGACRCVLGSLFSARGHVQSPAGQPADGGSCGVRT